MLNEQGARAGGLIKPAMIMTAAEHAKGRFMRAPDGHDGGGEGAGAAGAAGGGEGGGGAGGAGGEGGGGAVSDAFAGAGGQGGAGEGGAGASDGKWAEIFSGDAIDADTPSHRDWLAKKGFKDPNALIASYRETEKALRSGDKVAVPGEGASADDVAAFRAAIGVPEKADGYEVKLPDGVQGELDASLIGSFQEVAHKAGIPKAGAEALGKWFIEQQLDLGAAEVAQRNQETQDVFKEWGAQKDMNLALANRAAATLGLDKTSIADIQKGFGARRTLELLKKLGDGLAEDAFQGGERKSFGIDAASARVELDKMNGDKETREKILAGDQALIGRRNRLMAALAAQSGAGNRAPA